ncbi:MAG: hypothetical protein QXL96_09020 [Ignisphaera sp.]
MNENKTITIIHLVPKEIESGSVVDSRLLLEKIIPGLARATLITLLTNDIKIYEKVKHKNVKIFYIPLNTNPLYDYRLWICTIIGLLKTIKKTKIIYIMEEYPPITIPAIILSNFFGKWILLKCHSLMCMFNKNLDYLQGIFINLSFLEKIIFIFTTTIFQNFIKISRNTIILVPNHIMRDSLIKITKRHNIYFVYPGNYLDTEPLHFHGISGKNATCFVSSKIDRLSFLMIKKISEKNKIYVIGKPIGPLGRILETNLLSLPNLEYLGIFPSRRELFKIIGSDFDRIIYVTSYETWSYVIFESLMLGKKVIVTFFSEFVKKEIIEVYKNIFNKFINIYPISKTIFLFNLTVKDRLKLYNYCLTLNKMYVGGICRILTKLLEL